MALVMVTVMVPVPVPVTVMVMVTVMVPVPVTVMVMVTALVPVMVTVMVPVIVMVMAMVMVLAMVLAMAMALAEIDMTDNITVSRELLRQVLNAACSPYCAQDLGQLMPALRAALEQPSQVQEPVAWSMTYNGDHCGNFYESRTDAEERMAVMNAKHPLDERTIEPLYPAPPPAPDIDYDALKGTDMTDKITELKQLVIEAADRIEQLERENEANERNLCQLTDDLAASRRENAELRKELQAEYERQRRVWPSLSAASSAPWALQAEHERQRRVWAEIQSQHRDHSPLSMTVAFDNRYIK
jgi:hypothetical protein